MSAPDADRVERYRETIRAAMEEPLEHDSCGNCGDENELDWRPEEREITLAYAAMALADKEHARLIAEVEALRRVVRGSGQSRREAEERAEAAEAIVAKVAALHCHVEGEHFDYCAECDERESWPCPTAAALQADDAALMTLAEARVSTDDGVRHDLDDVAREFGVTG